MRNLLLLILCSSAVLAGGACSDDETAGTRSDVSGEDIAQDDAEVERDVTFRDLGLDTGDEDAGANDTADGEMVDADAASDAADASDGSAADASLDLTDGSGDVDATPCESDCTRAGAGQCVAGGLQTCTFNPATGCLNWSAPESCGPDRRCEEGACLDGACVDECFFDGVACSLDNTQLEGCEDVNLDGCREVVAVEVCTDTQVCNTGACVTPSCTNECDMGQTVCGTGGVLACGNFDGDICREFGGGATPCEAGFACSAGVCSPEGCTNDCSAGQTTCAAGGVQGCGNFDADLCLEFGGPVTACDAGLSCVAGACRAVATQCLLISEYLEGTGSDKAIEIFNCGSAAYDLGNVLFCSRQNESLTGCFPSGPPLEGRLEPGVTLSICNGGSVAALRSRCDEVLDGFPNFNGNDRLFIYRDNDRNGIFGGGDTIIDSFGEPGGAVSGTPYQDTGFRRCSTEAYTSGPFDVTRYYRAASASDYSNIGVAPVLSGCD
jgi:hypothetical protein